MKFTTDNTTVTRLISELRSTIIIPCDPPDISLVNIVTEMVMTVGRSMKKIFCSGF